MPENKDMIHLHLMEYLYETHQWGTLRWDGVLGFCLGYYGKITDDHIWAVKELEKSGAVIK